MPEMSKLKHGVKTETLHGSAVALKDGGVLLLGAAGSGKSSLAIHLIDHYGGRLIADDRIRLTVEGTKLKAAPPDNLAGLLELRGLGIVAMPHQAALIDMAVELVARAEVPRLAELNVFTHEKISVPLIRLHGHDMASGAIVARAVAHLSKGGFATDGIYR